MNRSFLVPLLLLVVPACPKGGPDPAAPADGDPNKAIKIKELGLLMANDINPPFSRLSFLMFHGDSMDEDPAAIKVELALAANALRTSIGRLRVWSKPPTESVQGREVFYTFATSVDASAERLLAAIASDDKPTAAGQLEQIAKTCNNCHHFFRLDLEDSVVGPNTKPTGPAANPIGHFGMTR